MANFTSNARVWTKVPGLCGFPADSLSMFHADMCGTLLQGETPGDMPAVDMLCAYVCVLFGYLETQP